jgi:hypothetical protein
MSRCFLVLAVAAALAPAATAAGDPAASGIPVDVVGLKAGRAHGTITFYAAKDGAKALADVRQLPPNASVRILVQAGDCRRHGASFAELPGFRADARGRVTGRTFVRFHGAKLPLRAISSEPHAVRVLAAGRAVACGEYHP